MLAHGTTFALLLLQAATVLAVKGEISQAAQYKLLFRRSLARSTVLWHLCTSGKCPVPLQPYVCAGGTRVLPPPEKIVVAQTGFTEVTEHLDTMADLSMLLVMHYCQTHGYQYRRYTVQNVPEGRVYGWTKPDIWLSLLSEFELVVGLDLDVIFERPHLSLEHMLVRWGFTSDTLVLQPLDPDIDINYVFESSLPEGKLLMANIGFMVLKSDPKVLDLLGKWSRCTTEILNCNKGLEDQLAWNAFIRPLFVEGTEWVGAPCNEANGHTQIEGMEHDNDGCNGTYVSHHWNTLGSPSGVVAYMHRRVWSAFVVSRVKRDVQASLLSIEARLTDHR